MTLWTLFFDTRHESDWKEVECQLLDDLPRSTNQRVGEKPGVDTGSIEAPEFRPLGGFAAYASSTRSVQQFLDERREEKARESGEFEEELHG